MQTHEMSPHPLNSTLLPDHARLIAGPDVWIEGEALEQLARVARFPGCVRAVGLPDLHSGPGIPLGATFAFEDRLIPHLVGGDAGCGVRVVAVPRLKATGDQLERRVLAATEAPALPEVDPIWLLDAVWQKGPRGLLDVPGVPDSLAELAALEPELPDPSGTLQSSATPEVLGGGEALGTIGGGNHFLEISRVAQVVDREQAARMGLARGEYAVVAHSGSRALGRHLALRWAELELSGEGMEPYLRDLAGACRFARANRLVLAWRMLTAVGAARAERISGMFDVTHNTVETRVVGGRALWLHRKGTAPAEAGQPTVVLGSRGAATWVMVGAGSEECLCSVAHGAGRRMGRTEAVGKLKSRYTRQSLRRTDLGGRVICDDPELLYAEHPDCYKDIESVVESLEQAGAAHRVAALHPLVTVKR